MHAELAIVLPLTNPVLKFFIILLLICLSTILTERYKLPNLLFLIFAGAVIGPFGFNLIERNDGIILSGTAGMLYILFLAGLEINSRELKSSGFRSIVFGLYTFLIPMILGLIAGRLLFGFSWDSAVLLASMFASHTLISYPIIRKYGMEKDIAVKITVGGTILTDTLALLILAVIVRKVDGGVSTFFWIQLGTFILLYLAACLTLIPVITRWFFTRFPEPDVQYVFILSLVFLGALLSEMIGLEGIIGAFVVGLALNRLVAGNHRLMYRIDFMGNALFIPFFLIGIGMLIDFRSLVDLNSLLIGAVMIITATLAKFLAAWLTQKSFGFTKPQRQVIFGLSNAQAAATLAAVTVGYNVVTGESATGEPIRLLNEYVLNGTILMIMVTCTMATLSAQRGVSAMASASGFDPELPQIPQQRRRLMVDMSEYGSLDAAFTFSETFFRPDHYKKILCLAPIEDSQGAPEISRYDKNLNRFRSIAKGAEYEIQAVRKIGHTRQSILVNACIENGVTDFILSPSLLEDKNGTASLKTLQKSVNLYLIRSQGLNMIGKELVVYIPGSENLSADSLVSLLSRVISLTGKDRHRVHLFMSQGSRRMQHNISANMVIREVAGISQLSGTMETLSPFTPLLVIYHSLLTENNIQDIELFIAENPLFLTKFPLVTICPQAGDMNNGTIPSDKKLATDFF